jgi:PPOX class probable F420-dependent enzyme
MSQEKTVYVAQRQAGAVKAAVDRLVGVPLTSADRALLKGKSFGHLATLDERGAPHSTVVWVDADGDLVLCNTAEGRAKVRHMRRDSRVALSVTNADNPYKELAIQGQVVEITHEGADDHIDTLARRYLGQERYPFRQPGEQRVLVKILPRRIHRNGY